MTANASIWARIAPAGLALVAAAAGAAPPTQYGASYGPPPRPFSASRNAPVAVTPDDAPPDRVTVEKTVATAQTKITAACNLQGWQFALSVDTSSLTRVELSPTLSPTQTLCVYQTLYDAGIQLDRPAPVQVQQSAIRPDTPSR